LKEDIHFLGRQNSFSVIDEEDQLSIIHDIFKEGEISTKDIKPKKALEIIQRVKVDEIDLFTINQLNALRKIGIHSLNDLQSFRYIIKNYEKKLLKANLLDFDDLLILTKKLLSEHDDVCGK
jgi:DNA helicase-2/ATP-dependent DNA helicase PcrA